MRHFALSQWTDYSRGLTKGEQARAMREHLRSGCPVCEEAVATFRRVISVAEHDLRSPPPKHVVRSVKSYCRVLPLALSAEVRSIPAHVAYDSFLEAAPCGTRGPAPEGRRLVLYSSQLALDLKLDRRERRGEVVLEGEILDRIAGPLAGIPVTFLSAGAIASSAVSDDVGRFRLRGGGAGALRCCLLISQDEVLDVPLGLDEEGEPPDAPLRHDAHSGTGRFQ